MDDVQKKLVNRQVRNISDYQKIFSTPEGERVLYDMMSEHFFLKPTVDGAKDSHDVAFREGNRNVVLRILSILNTDVQDIYKKIEQGEKDAAGYRRSITNSRYTDTSQLR